MRRLIADEWLSLDGVAQAPGEPDEDRSGGFEHGGWHMQYVDEAFQTWMLENLTKAGGFVFGRRTYESFAGHWPNASEEEQVIADPLNNLPKYVASTTLADPLAWQNSTVLKGDVFEAVQELKGAQGDDLHVIGSTELVRALLGHGLVDELRVIIDPVLLGGGTRIFSGDGEIRRLKLMNSEVTSKGAIIATYALEG